MAFKRTFRPTGNLWFLLKIAHKRAFQRLFSSKIGFFSAFVGPSSEVTNRSQRNHFSRFCAHFKPKARTGGVVKFSLMTVGVVTTWMPCRSLFPPESLTTVNLDRSETETAGRVCSPSCRRRRLPKSHDQKNLSSGFFAWEQDGRLFECAISGPMRNWTETFWNISRRPIGKIFRPPTFQES